jgi:DNA-binding IclR family transcriptional regulator
MKRRTRVPLKRLPEPRYAAPALDKGLDILELLSKQEGGLTRAEIAERLQRSVGEVFRMIECLTRRSYLVQTDDTFTLGLKLFELSHEFPPMNRLVKEALPRMEQLAKAIDQSCHLSVLSGARQLIVAQVDRPGGVGFGVKIGATLDLVKSASGRVLLAFQSDEEARRLVGSADPELTAAQTNAALSAIRRVGKAGFAFSPSRQFSGVDAISYPILDRHGRAIAAVTVPYVTHLDDNTRTTASAAQAALATVSAEINVALGSTVVAGNRTSSTSAADSDFGAYEASSRRPRR